jgi:cell division protein FtsA
LGGNVISDDIKDVPSLKTSRIIKSEICSAWPGENRDNEIVSIPGLRGREPKKFL